MWLQEHPHAELQDVPGDLVTASASGLDPHITLQNAEYQLDRVAAKWAADLKRDPARGEKRDLRDAAGGCGGALVRPGGREVRQRAGGEPGASKEVRGAEITAIEGNREGGEGKRAGCHESRRHRRHRSAGRSPPVRLFRGLSPACATWTRSLCVVLVTVDGGDSQALPRHRDHHAPVPFAGAFQRSALGTGAFAVRFFPGGPDARFFLRAARLHVYGKRPEGPRRPRGLPSGGRRYGEHGDKTAQRGGEDKAEGDKDARPVRPQPAYGLGG